MFASSVWGAFSKNYDSFLASRIIGGIGMAPYEILVQSTIADLYFIHQRATRIALWNLFLLCGIAGGSLISGYIIEVCAQLQNKYAVWLMWFRILVGNGLLAFAAILFGIFAVHVVLFVPETSYHRTRHERRIPERKHDSRQESADTIQESKSPAKSSEVMELENEQPASSELKNSFTKNLRIYTGRHSKAPFLKILIRPFHCLFLPCCLLGVSDIWHDAYLDRGK